jgi:hypothetical protein
MSMRRRLVFGLDLAGAAPRGALVEYRWGVPRVRLLRVYPAQDLERGAPDGFAAVRADVPEGAELHVGIPADLGTHRIFTLPFADPERLQHAARGALASLVPIPARDGNIAWEAVDRQTQRTVVAATYVPRARLTAIAHTLAEADLEPTCVRSSPFAALAHLRRLDIGVASFVFVDLTPRLVTLVWVADGVPHTMRLLAHGGLPDLAGVAEELRWTTAVAAPLARPTIVIAGGPDDAAMALGRRLDMRAIRLRDVVVPAMPAAPGVRHDEFAASLGLALAPLLHDAEGMGFADALAPERTTHGALRHEWARTRRLGAVVATLLLVQAGTGALVATHRLRAAEGAIAAALTAQGIDPDLAADADTLGTTLRRLEHGGSDDDEATVLNILRELSARIDSAADMVLTTVRVDGDLIRLMGHARDQQTLAGVIDDLGHSPLLAEIGLLHTGAAGARVIFEVSARRRGRAGAAAAVTEGTDT